MQGGRARRARRWRASARRGSANASLELGDERADGRDEAGLDGRAARSALELADVGHGERDGALGPRAPGAWASPAGSARSAHRWYRPAVSGSTRGRSHSAVAREAVLERRRAAPSRARSPRGVGSESRICTSEPSGRMRASSVTISRARAGDRAAQLDDLADRDGAAGAELDRSRPGASVGDGRADEAVGGVGDEGEVALRA